MCLCLQAIGLKQTYLEEVSSFKAHGELGFVIFHLLMMEEIWTNWTACKRVGFFSPKTESKVSQRQSTQTISELQQIIQENRKYSKYITPRGCLFMQKVFFFHAISGLQRNWAESTKSSHTPAQPFTQFLPLITSHPALV